MTVLLRSATSAEACSLMLRGQLVFSKYQESLTLFVMRNWETSLSLLGLNIWLIRKLA